MSYSVSWKNLASNSPNIKHFHQLAQNCYHNICIFIDWFLEQLRKKKKIGTHLWWVYFSLALSAYWRLLPAPLSATRHPQSCTQPWQHHPQAPLAAQRGQLRWAGWMLLITGEGSWALLLPTASCHHCHTLLRKKRTFHSNVEMFHAAWGFAGRHHTQVLLCLCSAGPLNLNGISVIITFDWRQNKTKEGKSSQCANCVSPCHEDRQLGSSSLLTGWVHHCAYSPPIKATDMPAVPAEGWKSLSNNLDDKT